MNFSNGSFIITGQSSYVSSTAESSGLFSRLTARSLNHSVNPQYRSFLTLLTAVFFCVKGVDIRTIITPARHNAGIHNFITTSNTTTAHIPAHIGTILKVTCLALDLNTEL